VDWKLELIVVPVSDVDRCSWRRPVRPAPSPSAPVSEPANRAPCAGCTWWSNPDRADYGSYVFFTDPDGNTGRSRRCGAST